jgi:hypothetical protein
LKGHQFQDRDWAFDVRCKKTETQYAVVWRLVTDEERNKRRRLSRTEQEFLLRFCWKGLNTRQAIVDRADLNHWLNEYVFEGWWRSVNQAKKAVLDLVDKIAAPEFIDEVRWCCVSGGKPLSIWKELPRDAILHLLATKAYKNMDQLMAGLNSYGVFVESEQIREIVKKEWSKTPRDGWLQITPREYLAEVLGISPEGLP